MLLSGRLEMVIAKPELRYLSVPLVKVGVPAMMAISVIGGAAYYFTAIRSRQQAYANYLR